MAALASVSIVAGAIMVSVEVVSRKLFNFATLDIVTVGRAVMLLVGFLGAGYTLWHGRHVAVEFVPNLLRPWLRRRVQIAGEIVSLIFLAVFVKLSWDFAWVSYVAGAKVHGLPNVPIWPLKMIIPIGLGILFLQLIVEIWRGTRVGRGEDEVNLDVIS